MEQEILELAKAMQFNEKAEAQAVFDYTEVLKMVDSYGIEEELKKYIKSVISELIADELNHQMKLGELYVMLTGIEPNEN